MLNDLIRRIDRLEKRKPLALDDDNFIRVWNEADDLSRAFWIAEAQGCELLQRSSSETAAIRRGLDRLHIDWKSED